MKNSNLPLSPHGRFIEAKGLSAFDSVMQDKENLVSNLLTPYFWGFIIGYIVFAVLLFKDSVKKTKETLNKENGKLHTVN